MTKNNNEKIYWKKYKSDLLQGIDICLKKKQLLAAGKLIFCTFDSLAAFYIGYNDARSRNKKVLSGGGGRSTGNIYEKSTVGKYFDNYLKNCCNKIYRKTVRINNQEESLRIILYDDYRCGLIHEGRPKRNLKLGINNKTLFNKNTLSLIKMIELLLESIKEYENLLARKDKEGKARRTRWNERYLYVNN